MSKLYYLVFFTFLSFSLNAQTLLPDDWTDDTGIDTYQESTIVHGGSYSCKIDVNTGSQASCDFDNTTQIPVTPGDSYTVKLWYQTSTHVKLRIVVKWSNGNTKWGAYSNTAISTWTELTYSNTVPTGVTWATIDIRSYDQPGFSAPETQYIDDVTFESPTGTALTVNNGDLESWPSTSGPDNPDNFTATAVSTSQIDLSWDLNNNGDDVMVAWSSDGTFGSPADGTTYAAGDAIPGGGTVLINGNGTSFSHTGLSMGTQYYYKAWSVDASTAYSSGVTDDATTLKEEPSNHVSAFAAGTPAASSIPLTWDDNDGTVAADKYLLMINKTGTFTDPVDGTPQADDTDVSDGSGVVNVDHGDEAYTWGGLDESTHYYFKIYPYTNYGSDIDYKIDGTVPTTDASTTVLSGNTDLIISEVVDPKDVANAKYVELYNLSSDTIFFATETWYLARQSNGGGINDVELTDTILPGETYIVAYNQSDFTSSYGFEANQYSGNISGNGDDGYFLYYGGDHSTGTLIDAYGIIDKDGTGKEWEYKDGKAVRKRSVGAPNATWTASEWLISRAANTGDVMNMTPGQHKNDITWTGAVDDKWNVKGNWDAGVIPDISMNVTIPSGTSSSVIIKNNYDAACWDIDIDPSVILTVRSASSRQGSLIVGGTTSSSAKIKLYMTTGKWHGVAAPVSGQTGNNLYMGGNPDTWLKHYNENDNTYTYITDLGTALGDMKGWMMWVDDLSGALSDTTFTFNGGLRSGTVSPTESIVRSQAGADYGYNFIGNPFTAPIDWDDTLAWTKTNIDTAIYTYNSGNWATYASGTGTNGGSRYIAVSQGFFVQVKDDGSTAGTVSVSTDACAQKEIADFMKNRSLNDVSLIRLEVSNNNLTDETVVRLMQEATDGFDSKYDAHKLFSFNTNHPQIFSTANGKMSINTLPLETGSVPMDVTGKDGDMMIITLTERENMEEIWLVDETTGTETDLTKSSYSFTYNCSITNRFTLHFGIVGISGQNSETSQFKIYSAGNRTSVVIPSNTHANIEVYNLLGQRVAFAANQSGLYNITLKGNQYYIIKVYDSNTVETKKVLIEQQN